MNELEQLYQDLFQVDSLGACTVPSPILRQRPDDWGDFRMTSDADRIPVFLKVRPEDGDCADLHFEKAGARECIFRPGAETTAAIVTCGGLCPGLNDVIRGLVLTLWHGYGVRSIYGIRYGYAGLAPDAPHPPERLSLERVEDIHKLGGTILGSSRGPRDAGAMLDRLDALGVNLLFTIGGDGTLRGASQLAREARRRGQPTAIIGIPKTIDNDIPLVYKSFGFETAVEEAVRVLDGAHVEAKGAPNGVGLVKLMGRQAGFIAAMATRASGDVNYCLVPEVPVRLDGPGGFVAHLRERLRERGHAVLAVAEGACQDLIGDTGARDASGNRIFRDVGQFLKESLEQAFAEVGEAIHIKYFDPSYTIRSVAANSHDSVFCADLARYAAHAGMAGKTDMLVGYWHGQFTHVPFRALDGRTRHLRPTSSLWRSIINSTGQPVKWE